MANQAAYSPEKIQEYKHDKLKNFKQFCDDTKSLLIYQTEGKQGKPNNCQELF